MSECGVTKANDSLVFSMNWDCKQLCVDVLSDVSVCCEEF